MRDVSELLEILKISKQDLDSKNLHLSLTHSSTLNDDNKERDLFIKLERYREVGKTIYNLLLKIYIYENITSDPNLATKGHMASYDIFFDKFINRINIKEFFYVKDDVLNKKVEYSLTYQFLGFLYEGGFYLSLQNYFQSYIFAKSEIQLVNDYHSFIMEHAQARKLPFTFKELDNSGPSHNKTYKFELDYNGKSVIEEGNSKKNAKMNCCKSYYEKYLSDIKIELNSVENRGRKKYHINRTTQLKLEKLARRFHLSYEEVLICFTHPSLSNEYEVEDNSAIRAIGADVEKLYLIFKYYNKYVNMLEPLEITPQQFVAFIQSKPKFYQDYFENENLAHLIMGSKSLRSTEKAFSSACPDTFRSILFYLFYNYYSLDPIEKLDGIYTTVLSETDFRYINPLIKVNTKLYRWGIKFDYTYTTNVEKLIHYSKLNIQLTNSDYNFNGKGHSKKNAGELSALAALKWIYNQIMPFLLGEKVENIDIILLSDFIEFELSENLNKFNQTVYKHNYFGMDDALEGNESDFIVKISNTLKIVSNFPDHLYEKFVSFLTSSPQIFMTFLNRNTFLIETIILDVSDYIKTRKSTDVYSINDRWTELQNLNERLLRHYVSEKPYLIRRVVNPSNELQVIAVKNNPEAIVYIDSPSSEVLDYFLKNNNLPQSKLSTIQRKIKDINPDLLINHLFYEYEELLNESNNKDIVPIIRSDNFSFDLHIRSLFKLTPVKKFYVATGFVFSSGLELLRDELENLLSNDGEIKIIAGNLQNYNSGIDIINMDKKTANTLNLLMHRGVSIRTFDDQFYHGKVYYLESDTLKIIIIGSTNLSRQAFQKNKEIDCIYFFNNDANNQFTKIFDNYWEEAVNVPILDLTRFSNLFGFENHYNETTLNKISMKDMKRKIDSIPDDILRKRLTLWLEYYPSNIYDDIEITQQEYIAIEYSDRKMVVLESFNYGNSYFVFYDTSTERVLEQIEGKTKREIFELSGMDKRGYHAREMMKLEVSIKSYFIG